MLESRRAGGQTSEHEFEAEFDRLENELRSLQLPNPADSPRRKQFMPALAAAGAVALVAGAFAATGFPTGG
jgi:ferric-dicitrate binding protein FerR (iron transport regulator)